MSGQRRLKMMGQNASTEVCNFYLIGDGKLPAAYVARYDDALLFIDAPRLKALNGELVAALQSAKRGFESIIPFARDDVKAVAEVSIEEIDKQLAKADQASREAER